MILHLLPACAQLDQIIMAPAARGSSTAILWQRNQGWLLFFSSSFFLSQERSVTLALPVYTCDLMI